MFHLLGLHGRQWHSRSFRRSRHEHPRLVASAFPPHNGDELAWEDFWAKVVKQIKDGGLCFHDEWEVSIVVPDGPGVKEAIGATLLQLGGELPVVIFQSYTLGAALADEKQRARLPENDMWTAT